MTTLLLWHGGLTLALSGVLLLVTLSRAGWDRLQDRARRTAVDMAPPSAAAALQVHLDEAPPVALSADQDEQQKAPAAVPRRAAPLQVPPHLHPAGLPR